MAFPKSLLSKKPFVTFFSTSIPKTLDNPMFEVTKINLVAFEDIFAQSDVPLNTSFLG
jgi:hypothetical protein